MLGGVTSVVHGLGAMRNRLGGAHGQGKKPVRPAPRHAQLAVNLAGTAALFVIETWLAKSEAGTL
ncbi:abortive infection family protein [Thauera aminoaromatica]|uniref:abortive infection family protein n=1 Tax=Thauera aminoaromatica TaxID=164330 RepID=UPI0035B4D021